MNDEMAMDYFYIFIEQKKWDKIKLFCSDLC